MQSKVHDLQETQTLLDAVFPLQIDADKWGSFMDSSCIGITEDLPGLNS